MEMVESRVIESRGCATWTRLSASMSKVMATATLAPSGHGTGLWIIAGPTISLCRAIKGALLRDCKGALPRPRSAGFTLTAGEQKEPENQGPEQHAPPAGRRVDHG